MRIALVEDEAGLAVSVQEGLELEGFPTDVFHDAESFERKAGLDTNRYRLFILDIMLPGKDGIQFCRDLRTAKNFTPVMMLTARESVEDKVEALDGGADDYLVKPFSFEEFVARVRALLRRPDPTEGVLSTAGVVLDFLAREVLRDGVPIPLTTKEFDILALLMRNRGRAVSREDMLAHIWGAGDTEGSNVIDVHTLNLRKKIDGSHSKKIIRTVRGVGYAFSE